MHPGDLELAHIAGVDLLLAAEVIRTIAAVIGEPVVRILIRRGEPRRIDRSGGAAAYGGDRKRTSKQGQASAIQSHRLPPIGSCAGETCSRPYYCKPLGHL